MPEVTLSLPSVLGLLLLFLAIGAVLVYFATRQSAGKAATNAPTPSPTVTLTVTPTLSPTPATPTVTFTPLPSPTPQTYIVKTGDLCGGIALAFGVSVQSIVLLNNLPADCGSLRVGQSLLIPQPTPTPTSLPTATLSGAAATNAACEKADYVVQSNDTLGKIAANYAVPAEAIKEYNGRVNDFVRAGEKLTIPLCKRTVASGPTPTPTPPPPYAAPNLLMPADGAAFGQGDDAVTLQWASVGTLRNNESYGVTLEDVTAGQGKQVSYVPDTKFIVPASLRPSGNSPHVFRWWVITVRQVGTDKEGNPLWEVAGASSAPRDFVWSGGPGSAPAPATPTP